MKYVIKLRGEGFALRTTIGDRVEGSSVSIK